MKRLITCVLLLLSSTSYAASPEQLIVPLVPLSPGAPNHGTSSVHLPNPASVYCEQHGGQLRLEHQLGPDGWVGICVFPDGSYCEEWSYLRQTCKPSEHFLAERRQP